MKARAVLMAKPMPPIFYYIANIPPLKLQYMSPQSTARPCVVISNSETPQLIKTEVDTSALSCDNGITEKKWINNARCSPFVCPEILKKSDVVPLFPERDLVGELTVFTIVHQTQNDMADWNAAVFEERDQLVGDVCVVFCVIFVLTIR
jgi:hypothetical protein